MKKRILIALLAIMTMSFCAFSLVGCSGSKVDAPTNIKYDGATITWSSVQNADSYLVRINDGDERAVSAASYPYNANGQQFNVTVKAVSNGKKKNVESKETLKTFIPLNKIESLNIANDGVISWSAVENATGYLVRVDGTSTEITSTSFDGLDVGQHTVDVRAVVSGDSSYYSVWSPSASLTILGEVAKADITYKNGKVVWKYVSGTQKYELKINGVVVSDNIAETSYPYDAVRQDFEVSVKAIGNHSSTFDGKESEVKAFVFLDTVTNIRVEDGNAVWDAVGGADGYIVKINGVEHSVTEPRYNNLTHNLSTDIQVQPTSLNTTYFSDWSANVNVMILPAPTLSWNNNLLLDGTARANTTWDGVAQAAGYTVRVTLPDGRQEVTPLGEASRSFIYDFLLVGTYKVEVKASANVGSSGIYDSKYSLPITVKRLAAPEIQSVTSNPDRLTDGFTATFTQIDGATAYALYRDNIHVTNASNNQFNVANLSDTSVTEERRYVYGVRSLGSVGTSSGGIYVTVDSLPTSDTTFNITVLATPTSMNISGFVYSFGAISGAANGYSINVGAQRYTATDTSRDLQNLAAGVYDVNVCTRGNGTYILASDYSAAIKVIRISAPTNIRVGTETNEGSLIYDVVEHATSYNVVFDGNTANPVPATEIDNINSRITTTGTTVHMYSVANYFNPLKTEYYMTSLSSETKNFQKLATPTQITFSDTQIIWNPPSNINTQQFTPGYVVADQSYQTYNGEKTGTAMDITNLVGNQSYTFCVKAVGDGQNFVNSEYSTPVTVWKLAMPEVTRTDTAYTWNNVINAVGYAVYVDGVIAENYTHGQPPYSFTPKFNSLKDYKVEVYAVGDGGLNSINSQASVIIQKTKQLAAPKFSIAYSNLFYDPNGMIQVTVTEQSLNALGYCYQVAGATSFEPVEAETFFEHSPGSTGKFTVAVYALGGGFDSEGIYYLDSQTVGGNDSYSITLLGTPNSSGISFSKDGLLTWSAINGAVGGYEIEIVVSGGETITAKVTQPNYTLSNYASYNGKTLTVRIRALGNGISIINSAQVEKIFTVSA